MGDKGRQSFGKADTPSNKGKQEGIQQRETKRETMAATMGDEGDKPREGGHTMQQRETRRGTGDKGRQDPRREAARRETKPREGGHLIQQRETRRETRGDKTSGHTIQQRETRRAQWETKGDKQGETKLWEGERTIQQGGTMTETNWE